MQYKELPYKRRNDTFYEHAKLSFRLNLHIVLLLAREKLVNISLTSNTHLYNNKHEYTLRYEKNWHKQS